MSKYDMDLENMIKFIMEEDSRNVNLTEYMKKDILRKTKKETLFQKVSKFLNVEIEVPIPILSGVMAVVIFLTFIPVIKENHNTTTSYKELRMIDMGNCKIIMNDSKEVSLSEKDKD